MPNAVSITPNLTALRAWARAAPKYAEMYASADKIQERIKELEGKDNGKDEVKQLRQALSEIHNVTPYVLGITLERAAGDVSAQGASNGR
jgi:hypothetical protein